MPIARTILAEFNHEMANTKKVLERVPEEQAASRTILALGGTTSLRKIAAAVQDRHGVRVSHEAVRRVLSEAAKSPVRRTSLQPS